MADFGIKISQEGFDVKTCDDKDLVMSSEFNLLKTKTTGVQVTAGTVAHGLSYVPIFFTNRPFATATHYSLVGDDLSYCDATNLTTVTNNTRYYLFYQQSI